MYTGLFRHCAILLGAFNLLFSMLITFITVSVCVLLKYM